MYPLTVASPELLAIASATEMGAAAFDPVAGIRREQMRKKSKPVINTRFLTNVGM